MNSFAALILRLHRLLLIVGTVLIAVAASNLAVGQSDRSAWFVLAGGAILMYIADSASELESLSQRLSKSSDIIQTAARRDILSSGKPGILVLRLLVALVLVAIGFWD